MKTISKTTIAGLCLAVAAFLGSGVIVDMPPAALPWIRLAAGILGAVGLVLAKDAAGPAPALPAPTEPTAESIVAEARAKAAAEKAAGK